MGRRRTVTWLVLFGLLVAAFAGTVLVLNATLYSASGYVRSYLDALARHDVDAAVGLATDGTPPTRAMSEASDDLLDPRALGELTDIHLLKDDDLGDGRHRVSYGYSASGTRGSTSFTVEHTGARLGFFSDWRFVASPLGVLTVTPKHDGDFTVNALSLSSAKGANSPRDYRALTPGRYLLGHESSYFAAKPVPVLIERAGGRTEATVDIQANAKFVGAVQKELNAYLLKCTKQEVLLPTDCPFGQEIGDRIVDTPRWSMTRYPPVTIVPGETGGTWAMPRTAGAAHLRVQVKSIFDGSVSVFDRDVPFTVSYLITFLPDGTLNIAGQ
jgi:hypothetical protein